MINLQKLKFLNCLLRDRNGYPISEDGNILIYKVKGKDLVIENGCIKKQGKETSPVKNIYFKYVDEIEDNTRSDFDIYNLSRQIMNECFFDNGERWSDNRDERNFGNSTSLLMRINGVLNDDSFKK